MEDNIKDLRIKELENALRLAMEMIEKLRDKLYPTSKKSTVEVTNIINGKTYIFDESDVNKTITYSQLKKAQIKN